MNELQKKDLLKLLSVDFDPFYFFDDMNLSWEAKGFLGYLKKHSNQGSLNIKNEFEPCVQKLLIIIDELKKKGYLTEENDAEKWVLTKPYWLRDLKEKIDKDRA